MTSSVRELIEAAAKLLGSETKLAEACGVSQNAIWQAKSRGGRINCWLRSFSAKMGNVRSGSATTPMWLFPSRRFAENLAAKEAHLPRWVRQ
jgi:hypothetical protein